MPALTTFQAKIFAVALSGAAVGIVAFALIVGWSTADVWHRVGLGSLVALGCAALIAWIVSVPLAGRVRRIAAVAARLAAGDLREAPEPIDRTPDEIGYVSRALDRSVHTLSGRLDELTRDRARTEAILTSMVEGVLVVDRQGTIQTANQAARRFLRLQDHATGHHYLEAIRHPGLAELVDLTLHGQQPDALPLSLATDDGDRQLLVRVAPVAAAGGGAVLVLHDITDLRLTDQIRRDFVANVSHELRTPLTAIRGYLEALLDEELDAEDRQQFLAILSRHTQRMERLVKDLLRLARLDARQEAIAIAACEVGRVIDGVVTDLAPASQASQRVAKHIEAGAERVLADPAKLHDVLRNLIENAVAYAPPASPIDVTVRRQGEWATIEVADRGPGIPEADLTRVFERFYRVDKSRTADSGGTGLGLAIARHLVGLLGGDIQAANRAGGGAVFTVRLRAADGAHGAPANGAERATERERSAVSRGSGRSPD